MPAPGAGAALKTGAAPEGSGIIVIDLDSAKAIEKWLTLGPCPQTYTVTTPRGMHLYFEHPGFRVPNSQSELAEGIDVRGDGGIIVAPGSPHASGGTYKVTVDVLPAPAPAWLLDWFRSRPAPTEVQPAGNDVTDSTERAYRRELFAEACRTMPPSIQGQGGDRALYNLVQYGAHDLELPHADVFEIVREDFDPRCDPPWGDELDERVAHQWREARTRSTRPRREPSPAALAYLFGGKTDASAPAPLALPPPSKGLPLFPLRALPPALRDFVHAETKFAQAPIDLSAMLVLGCCSAAIAGRAEIEIEPGYVEPLNLFVVVALPPAERKSATFRDVFQPLHDVEKELVEASAQAISEAKTQRDLLIEQIKKRKSAYARLPRNEESQQWAQNQSATLPSGGIALSTELARLEKELHELQIPAEPQLIANDVTMERLAGIMAEQGGRLCVSSAEGEIFAIIAGRYSSTGQSSFEILLKGHAGDFLRIDRQSKNRPAVRIDRPCLTLALAVQPAIIANLAKNQDMRSQGLLARFLYSIPTSRVGSRHIETNPVPDNVRKAYHDVVRQLATATVEGGEPFTSFGQLPMLSLSEEAKQLHRAFRAEIEPRLIGDLAEIADWGGKWAGAVARIAGILHFAQGVRVTEKVSEATMGAAIEIGRYLLVHAMAAFGVMGQTPEDADAKAVLAWVIKAKLSEFTTRHLARLMCPKAISRDRLRRERAVQALVDQGLVVSNGKGGWRLVEGVERVDPVSNL